MKNTCVYGWHAIEAALTGNAVIVEVYVLAGRMDERVTRLTKTLAARSVPVLAVDKERLDHLSEQGRHQGVVALLSAHDVPAGTEAELMEIVKASDAPFLLFLDGVQDPHNLGACLRSAYAFGVDAVVVPKDRSVGLTPIVKKVACGAAENLPFFQVTNMARTMRALQEIGVWFYGADADATTTLPNCDLRGAVAWVLGGEGNGLREQTKKTCDFLVAIPMQRAIESLNVSVACAVCLYATQVQRKL